MRNNYKITKPRFSEWHHAEVVDILKRGKVLWIFPFWRHHDTILNMGQAEEVVYLLNNPDVMQQRIKEAVKKYYSLFDDAQPIKTPTP